MNDQSNQQPRPPREWVTLTTITNPTTPVVVRVQTTVSGKPLYSMEIGHLREDRVMRYMPVFVNQDSSVVPMDLVVLQSMIRQAEDAIAVDAARKAAEWATRRPPREDRGRPEQNRSERRGGERRRRRDRDEESGWR